MIALRTLTLVLTLAGVVPRPAFAASAVFDGDPVDPASGSAYEILPGFPLVLPGPDGLLGTGDDGIDAAVTGDIDLVVRSGSQPAAATIPPPTAQGGHSALPVGTAGSRAAGGVEIPFTVFLSDGVASATAPAGNLLAATDMDAIPVVVAAFADLDRDGFIGPTDRDGAGGLDNGLEVRELEPVGRAVALFSAGVARGNVAVHVGLPASQGGLMVALCAIALTGPFDPAFFGGSIPRGPAITTAFPFIPQRDLGRLIRDRAAAVGPETTLQDVIQFAAVPSPGAGAPFALPLDGSSVTTDAAVVNAQAPVSVAFREDLEEPGLQQPVHDLAFGTRSPGNGLHLRLLAVDRWGNPADPGPAGLVVSLQATPPLNIFRPASARLGRELIVRGAEGVRLRIEVPRNVAVGTQGSLTAEKDGAVVAAVPYSIDSRANRPRADIEVPSRQASTIQAAIDTVSDRNRDASLVVELGPGLYQENVAVNRPVVLRGQGPGHTVVQGNGLLATFSVTASGASLRGLTAVGGSTGIGTTAPTTEIVNARVLRNVGAGITISGAGAQLWRTAAEGNGGDGLLLSGAANARGARLVLAKNRGNGAVLSGVQSGELADSQIADNGTGGISLVSSNDCRVSDNQSVNNVGSGLEIEASQDNDVLNNLFSLNDGDGLSMDSTSGTLVSGNAFESNHGYGLFVRRSTNDDFSAAAGLQAPAGDNRSINNRQGDVFVRPD